ncbi:hypothetical protein SDC9_174194 [bioreactor metagenome]|uniref:Uncharacterized protein n=1 Tax=bioreactor metagenome TaxID=1076179 RepID=A0A645GLN3_9ZZZZ
MALNMTPAGIPMMVTIAKMIIGGTTSNVNKPTPNVFNGVSANGRAVLFQKLGRQIRIRNQINKALAKLQRNQKNFLTGVLVSFNATSLSTSIVSANSQSVSPAIVAPAPMSASFSPL